jgi:hypothetical protein
VYYPYSNDDSTLTGISSQLTSLMNGRCLLLLRQEVRNIDFIALLCIQAELGLPDMKFVLLHEGKNDDGIKSFFMDVWELYVKVSFRFEYNKYMREN